MNLLERIEENQEEKNESQYEHTCNSSEPEVIGRMIGLSA